jgi:hypothetical protein
VQTAVVIMESGPQYEVDAQPDLVPTPLTENMVVPPVFKGLTRELDQLVEQPLLGPRADYPPGKSVAFSQDTYKKSC